MQPAGRVSWVACAAPNLMLHHRQLPWRALWLTRSPGRCNLAATPCTASRMHGPTTRLHDGEQVVQDAGLQLEAGLVERVCSGQWRAAGTSTVISTG